MRTMVPNNGESNGKENGKRNGSWDYIGVMLYYSSRSFICGYYGTQYRVRLYPPLGYSILYKEYDLTGFNHQESTTHLSYSRNSLKGVI